ncbi:hypothetical protein [Nocardioides deserti]|uniref:Uncharacterized protein n=1 Tax=Nocardioides deserti TaxID=1588644 RepID=A0ABR6UB44_9ACTN|nr:hypothetical protein [Nocardioides deserti]MBC2961353.1 hypothetical protein [Nocardioides deserti]GGO72501.1 hypothetical protein GCM10012276_16010 [Nocardioides deserti]
MVHRLSTSEAVGGSDRVRVAHSTTSLPHGLEPHEGVVLVDGDGEQHLAVVADIEFELEDTVYVLEVGARVPAETADRLVAGAGEPAGEEGVTEVIRLLGELRRRVGQRAP